MREVSLFGETTYEWQIGDSTFQAWPERGARLMRWDQPNRPIIHWPSINSAEEVTKARGGNPVLFPFSARTFNKGEIGKWQTPEGLVRPMPNHGITRQGRFDLRTIDETGFTARLITGEQENHIFPYQYQFDVSYRFEKDAFEVVYQLINLEPEARIPWSAGHHFYFRLPWVAGTTREDYEIDIPAENACYHSSDGSLNSTEFSTPTKFSEPELSDRIHYGLNKSSIEFRCLKDDSKVAIKYADLDPENALVTWTEANNSEFYCVEPWMGPPNAIETNIGLHWVDPGETESFSIRIEAN